MASNSNGKNKTNNNGPKEPTNHAYKPACIGEVIKTRLEEIKMTPQQFAVKIGRNPRWISQFFKRKHISILELMLVSEVVQKDLLREYCSNVPPENNGNEENQGKDKYYQKIIDELENKNGILKNRIHNLEGQIEALERRLDGRRG